jgi:ParB family chromosome partitioning protein
MTAQAEKITEQHDGKVNGPALEKAGIKPSEKPVLEKRRALGRGLESLLPGPRVIASATPSQISVPAPQPGHQLPSLSHHENQIPPPNAHGPVNGAGISSDSSPHRPVPVTVPDLHAAEATASAADGLPIVEIPVDEISDNPHQTRSTFDSGGLQELADSIRVQGVMQPIVVRPVAPGQRDTSGPELSGKELRYILILGERRLRASKLAGKTTIPAVVKRVSEQQAAEMTLVENLQRQDLNCMDQAKAFGRLSEHFRLTQEEIGKRVGISREAVSNYMRLLRLPGSVQMYLKQGQLSYSHARILLMLEDDGTVEKLATKAVEEKVSVLKLDDMVNDMQFKIDALEDEESNGKRRGARWVDPNVRAAQRNLETILGMKVRIRDHKGKGTIRIEYTSLEDYDCVVGLLKGKN